MIGNIIDDLRLGLRSLLAKPGFAIAALLSLAIGIGANTTLFAVVNALLLKPVEGIGAPQRVVEIGRGSELDTLSYPDFRDFETQAQSFDALFAYSLQALNVSGADDPQRALGLLVSGDYFKALGAHALHGRVLGAGDDGSAPQAVAVASYAAWQKFFGGDSAAIGRDVSINGRRFTLIGVAPPEFHGHIAVMSPDFYLPLHQRNALREDSHDLFADRRSLWLQAGGRLKDGVGIGAARAELATLAERIAKANPAPPRRDDGPGAGPGIDAGIGVEPLRGIPASLSGPLALFSTLLLALTGAILLLACVNVAGMLIARGEARRHEIAMRFVLGASRRRVIAQLLAESCVLALAAGVLGLLLAGWWRSLLGLIDPPAPFPLRLDVPLDSNVLLFALALTLGTTLLFGLLPALRVSNRAPRAALASATTVTRGTRLRESLVVTQIAVTLVLLVSAGLFVRALQRAVSIDVGFDVAQVLSADFDLGPSGYGEAKRADLQQRLLHEAAAIPGVEHAALAAVTPLNFSNLSLGCVQAPGLRAHELCPNENVVSGDYFSTLGMRVRGRAIDARDTASSDRVAVVNETLARRLAADGDVLGRRYAYGEGSEQHTLTVIGVVADSKYASLSEDPQPFLFVPLTQQPFATTSLFLRTSLPAADIAAQLRAIVRGLDGALPAPQVHPMQDILALSLLPQRIAGMIAAALGAVGLLLAAIGLYGLIAFYVASRTREFGIALALGASPAHLLGSVLRRGAWLCGIGLALGAALAAVLALLISGLLFGTQPGDALAFAGAIGLLGAAALLACYVPARRAARLHPMVALRQD